MFNKVNKNMINYLQLLMNYKNFVAKSSHRINSLNFKKVKLNIGHVIKDIN